MNGAPDNFKESRIASFLSYAKKGFLNVCFSTISSALMLLDVSSRFWQQDDNQL